MRTDACGSHVEMHTQATLITSNPPNPPHSTLQSLRLRLRLCLLLPLPLPLPLAFFPKSRLSTYTTSYVLVLPVPSPPLMLEHQGSHTPHCPNTTKAATTAPLSHHIGKSKGKNLLHVHIRVQTQTSPHARIHDPLGKRPLGSLPMLRTAGTWLGSSWTRLCMTLLLGSVKYGPAIYEQYTKF